MGKFIDLTGKRFGYLTVLYRDKDNILPSGLKEPMWICTCDCGNIVSVRGAFLRSGHTSSCGCKKDEFEDLSGQVFGNVFVLKPIKSKNFKKYLCLCKCGNKFITRGSSLKNGHTKSCGCEKRKVHDNQSKGEKWISEYFYHKKYTFETQKFFPDLLGVNNGLLFFDFYISIDGRNFVIECQGDHHYKPISHFGGIEKYNICVEHDKIKREFVEKQDNLYLIEVEYPSHCTKDKLLKTLKKEFLKYSIKI